MKQFAEGLKEALLKKGLASPNQAVIAVTGKTKQQVCNMLKGRSQFLLADLAKIDRAYDIDAETWKKLIHNFNKGEDKGETKPT